MTRDCLLYPKDIVENVDEAVSFIGTMDYDGFLEDKKTVNAVVRSLEVIGEASKNVPDNIRKRKLEIPWREMAGMRDKCIHFYFGIDHETVWVTVKESIPRPRPLVQALLDTLSSK